jgi:protein-S-isoprenylcysteine O-methyltransferase Ste14
MTATYLILVSVHLAAIVGRCRYELLKRSGRVDTRRPLVFWVVFADMVVPWAAWFGLGALDPVRLNLPEPLRWAGLGLTIAGAVLFVGTVLTLRALENTTVLVTTGLFTLTRHPAYLGFVLWLVGWPLFQGGASSLALGVVGIAATLWWRQNEERALVVQFGEAYRDYQRRTWF